MTSQDLPIARVLVDVALAHLDRPFDYAVPEELAESAVAGTRVKVRFAGRQVNGFVVERAARSEHARLAPLLKVVSPEVVLTPGVLRLSRAVADRWAGTLGDVVRLAVPPRHARAEKAPRTQTVAPPVVDEAPPSGRTVWSALPTEDVAVQVARMAAAAVHAGRGVIVCVPDQRAVDRWSRTFTDVLGRGVHVELTASLSAERRYRSFLALSRGDVRIVLGTRSAAYAPVADLGLMVMWDDGDDLYAEPRAPYAHSREVLMLRSVQSDAALVLASHARSVEAQSLVESGWARERVSDLHRRREAWPRLTVTDGAENGRIPLRLPTSVVKAIRSADGPVLVQVPRRGYRTGLACQRCRHRARCVQCDGPLAQLRAGADPTCRWCGRHEPWRCSQCGDTQLRAPVVGHVRTAEEFARTFADRTVVTSGGDHVRADIDDPASLVLATPGAEPVVAGGYGLVVLLDTALMLARDDVRVVEESFRRWTNALALGRPGGPAVAVGAHRALQLLVRADVVALAEAELADRTATHLPPSGRLAVLEGPPDVVEELAPGPWTEQSEVLGPVSLGEGLGRLVVRCPRSEGLALSARLKDVQSIRSAAKEPPLRVRIDPVSW